MLKKNGSNGKRRGKPTKAQPGQDALRRSITKTFWDTYHEKGMEEARVYVRGLRESGVDVKVSFAEGDTMIDVGNVTC